MRRINLLSFELPGDNSKGILALQRYLMQRITLFTYLLTTLFVEHPLIHRVIEILLDYKTCFFLKVCQGTCLCAPSTEGYGRGKVLYCYGEVGLNLSLSLSLSLNLILILSLSFRPRLSLNLSLSLGLQLNISLSLTHSFRVSLSLSLSLSHILRLTSTLTQVVLQRPNLRPSEEEEKTTQWEEQSLQLVQLVAVAVLLTLV